MITPQLIEKMNQLKAALEANPEFIQNLMNTANEPFVETEHPLLSFASHNDIDITAEELQTFFEAMQSPNAELDDALLEMIAGGQAEWYQFWKKDWWYKISHSGHNPIII